MDNLLALSSMFFSIALLCYTFSLIMSIRKKYLVVPQFYTWLNVGFVFDVIAIVGVFVFSKQNNVRISFHGILGYVATFLILIEVVIVQYRKYKLGKGARLGKPLGYYGLVAYAVWLAAFFSGMFIELQ
jgi:hypothetical protein